MLEENKSVSDFHPCKNIDIVPKTQATPTIRHNSLATGENSSAHIDGNSNEMENTPTIYAKHNGETRDNEGECIVHLAKS